MTIDTRGVPECVRCGACCFSDAPDYLAVLSVDSERIGRDAERWTERIDGRLYMRIEGGRCAALTIQDSGEYLCSIYERRPDVCRWLERGSGYCRGELTTKSDLARATLVQIRLPRPDSPQG